METPNFVVIAEKNERRAREAAVQFERFREAVGLMISAGGIAADVPTVVVLFDSAKSFAPYRPRFDGKPVQMGGYFVGSESENLIALSMEDPEQALRTIFHEYGHLVITNLARGLPLWLNEGLAQYYSTFALREGGRSAALGLVIPAHLQLLNNSALISLDDLLLVDYSSPVYNQGVQRDVFYAQSWALVHMLVSGEPNRSADLTRYIRLAAAGTPSVEAWRQVFGTEDVIPTLKKYLSRRVMRGYQFRFDEEIDAGAGGAVRLSEADAEALLGDLLLHVEPGSPATQLESAASMKPASHLARVLLGLARLDRGDSRVARDLLLEAATASDWLVQYYVAVGLTRTRPGDPGDAAFVLSAVNKVLAARPNLANALAMKATVPTASLEERLAAIQRARELIPGREDYIFLEAELRAANSEFVLARKLLGPMMSERFSFETRDRARRAMTRIVQMEQDTSTTPPEPPPAAVVSSAAAVSSPKTAARTPPLEPAVTVEPRAEPKPTPRRPGVIYNEDVLKLAAAGIGDDVIIASIRNSKTQFELNTEILIEFKRAGVSDRVLTAMLDAPLAEPSVTTPKPPVQPTQAERTLGAIDLEGVWRTSLPMTTVQITTVSTNRLRVDLLGSSDYGGYGAEVVPVGEQWAGFAKVPNCSTTGPWTLYRDGDLLRGSFECRDPGAQKRTGFVLLPQR